MDEKKAAGKPAEKKKAVKEEKPASGKIAVVRVRGGIGMAPDAQKTLKMLNLYNKNWCVVIDATPSNLGMIRRAKDYVTWGEISDEVHQEMIEKRGEEFTERTEDSKKKIQYRRYFTHNKKKYRKYFRLSPPRKGYGNNGVKMSFSKNGALGYRADKINDLIKRMM